MIARIPKLGMLLALTTIAVACEDDGTGVTPPAEEDVTGEYVATEGTGVFTSETDDETTDLLGEGAEITLVLEEGGATSGTLLVPGLGEDGADLEAELAGTWELDGFTIALEIDAGTFLDGLELEWSEGLLSASGTLDDETTFEIEVERDMS